MWPAKSKLLLMFNENGSPEDFSNFVTAVIHEGSFDKLASFIDQKKIPMLKSSWRELR
jgi:1-pyrroline-5-carboxylate dehydrogenase